MTGIDPAPEFDEAAISRYWGRVVGAMTEVFGMKRAEALSRVQELRVIRSERTGRAADYHVEPLRIAADLAGARISPEHVREYLQRSKPGEKSTLLPLRNRPNPMPAASRAGSGSRARPGKG